MGTFDYVRYDDKAAAQQAVFKTSMEQMEGMIATLQPGRARSLALTKLEEAYMWVGKQIRDEQIERTKQSVEAPERGE